MINFFVSRPPRALIFSARRKKQNKHCLYRPISSQTCCTLATAPGAAVVGRKQASSADQMVFWLISAVYRERFLLNDIFAQRFQARSGQAFDEAECWLKEKIFVALVG